MSFTQITELIAEKTDAENSGPFDPRPNSPVTVTMHGAVAENVPIEMKIADGTWEEMVSSDLIFTTTLNAIQIVAPGTYRVAKPVTVGAVGFTISRY